MLNAMQGQDLLGYVVVDVNDIVLYRHVVLIDIYCIVCIIPSGVWSVCHGASLRVLLHPPVGRGATAASQALSDRLWVESG